jgi:hypothetical protein
MKMLSAIGLATVLVVSASAASAERHGKGHQKKGWSTHKVEKKGFRGGHHADYRSGHSGHRSKKISVSYNYYPKHYGYRSGRYYGHRSIHHNYRPPHHRYHHGASRYRYDVFPALVGAAIVGSVINHSLYHTHGGAVCYDNHSGSRNSGSSDSYDRRSSGYSEVSGCHRIERMPDGSERRVEVPLSQCQ